MPLLTQRTKRLLAHSALGVGTFALTATGINMAYTASPEAPASTSSSQSAAPQDSSASVRTLKIGAASRISRSADISLPVDSYRQSPSASDTVNAAVYKATRICASRYGVKFDAAAPSEGNDATNNYGGLFGLVDLAPAEQWGYHPASLNPSDPGQESGPAADPAQFAPNYTAVVAGEPAGSTVNGLKVPAGGCIAEGRSQAGKNLGDEALIEEAMNYGLGQSDRDTRVRDAVAAWSKCMSGASYNYATPQDANNDPRWGTAQASPEEIATATADVKCKSSTNLTGIRVAVAAAWVNAYIRGKSGAFDGIRAHNSSALARAHAVLSSAGSR